MLKHTCYRAALDSFAASLTDDTIAPAGVTVATSKHVSVYRNNVRLNRIAALTDAFVNVVKLVGDDYFRALARVYVDCTPAKSADLHEDGAGLPAFIRGFQPAEDFPYLGDIADVDWRLHRAYFAADTTPVNNATLAELGPDRFAAASIEFAPSVALVRSRRWPIADILHMHEDGPPAQLGAGGQSVLIWREGYAARWQPLAPAEAQAMIALLSGEPVQTAFADTNADANSLLSQLFGRRLVLAVEENHHEDRL